ncbi:short-chain-fatty-acid-CoA ligase [Pyrenophora tritici-repentis Pt-1C-BFP]|uniref:Short-chain-fatty-acid-CoA ligase n=1 Tax=Pyrenophora tritici-repentis (strain Pt-1C-BFP) TaxID=426418 RepID=B2VWW6_PYRTR|nr:short-chain-fatty-acid-CoA ligase [Pyrenophora tritici-repentis Pt-1C-BFP]EDU41116.1 short-chain-fatty-acid-CoA ligase [Pyrenophora tritici-repentis Pt-1C-BFP]
MGEIHHPHDQNPALHRLNQTLLQIDPYILPPYPNLSLVSGPLDPPLLSLTLSQLLRQQATLHASREAVVIPWTGARWTYQKLWEESSLLARALLKQGVRPKDRIGVMSGNCEKYIALVFATVRVGAVCVTLNNTYTATEVEYALRHTRCTMLFTTPKIARFDNMPLLERLGRDDVGDVLPDLKSVCLIRGQFGEFVSYETFRKEGEYVPEQILDIFGGITSPHDVANLQFTSGSTGNPKAAMLTHHNLVNNSRFIGDRMDLTPNDTLCCPPPLFHCFGLTLGVLAVLTHGAKIVFPAESFDPVACMRAIDEERCTALHGVPAMMESIMDVPRPAGWTSMLRTGIVAGSPVPKWLMERMVNELHMTDFTSSYGLTEASPTVFNAHTNDSLHARLTTVGTVMPHARVKIVDRNDVVVPIGVRGELCVAGYQVCRGYWENAEKTAELIVRDEYGEPWLHTGDEAVLDVDGYCTITGRFKDIIIRGMLSHCWLGMKTDETGGENIYPLEIEERLVAHPSIARAIVVGVSHPRYVEVPVAFLAHESGTGKPDLAEVQKWVRMVLGRHKAPVHIFWLGEDCDAEVPLTGSGKIKKFVLRDVAEKLLGQR